VRTKKKLDQKRNAKPNEYGTLERVEQKQTPPESVFRTFKQLMCHEKKIGMWAFITGKSRFVWVHGMNRLSEGG
jgi:hypothetical protein